MSRTIRGKVARLPAWRHDDLLPWRPVRRSRMATPTLDSDSSSGVREDGQRIGVEDGEGDRAGDRAEDPKGDHHSDLWSPLHVEMEMQRRHFE